MNFALFFASVAWYTCATALASSAASGFAIRLGLGDYESLIKALCLLFLIVAGLMFLRTLEREALSLHASLGLPSRKTAKREWAIGVAVGWGISVLAVLPTALTRGLNIQLWTTPRAFLLTGVAFATLALNTLAIVMALYGFGLHRLMEATGKVRATIIVMAIVAIHFSLTPSPMGTPDGVRISVALLAALIFCLCWTRTHAVWLAWGMYFAWGASTALLFGLPLGVQTDLVSVIDSRAFGPLWLTGGDYGPEASVFLLLLLLASIPLVMRLTDDFAWEYTRPPIIAAGYPVEVAPPAAHVQMEKTEAAAPSLVQILPAVAPSRIPPDESESKSQ